MLYLDRGISNSIMRRHQVNTQTGTGFGRDGLSGPELSGAKSYEARTFGVTVTMHGRRARCTRRIVLNRVTE
jgi:hypothetical protein